MLLQISVPVDARYFARGGVCDAELEAMKVLFCQTDVLLCGADKTILWDQNAFLANYLPR